jgi:hypothetical protein
MTKALIVIAMPALLIAAECGKPAEQTANPAATDAMANTAISSKKNPEKSRQSDGNRSGNG